MRATPCSTFTSWTAGCAAPASVGGSATAPRSSRITRRWPPGCSRCTRSPAMRGGWTPRPGCSTSRSEHFADPEIPAGGSIPPTTPSNCWCGLPIRWTGRRRRVRRRSPRPCSPQRIWCPRRGPTATQPPPRSRWRRRRRCWRKLPRSGGHWLAVAEAAVRGPIQIAVAADTSDSALLSAARELAPGGAVVVGGAVNSSELLIDRDRVGGRRRRLRVPRPGLRPARHHRRGPRVRAGRARVAFGACRRPKTTPRPSTATSNSPLKAKSTTSSSLYAEDGTVEDPVGGEVHIGREAIRGFYSHDPRGRQRDRDVHAAGTRPGGGLLLGAHRRDRRQPGAASRSSAR